MRDTGVLAVIRLPQADVNRQVAATETTKGRRAACPNKFVASPRNARQRPTVAAAYRAPAQDARAFQRGSASVSAFKLDQALR